MLHNFGLRALEGNLLLQSQLELKGPFTQLSLL